MAEPAVKFAIPTEALVRKSIFTVATKNLIRAMKKAAKDLVERGIDSEATGNLSARTDHGFLITATGSKLYRLSDEDFVFVEDFDLEGYSLKKASGLKRPSSDTPIHHKIYDTRPEIRAIIHVHDRALSNSQAAQKLKIPITEQNLATGSKELLEGIVPVLQDHDAVIVREHGIFMVGKSVEECAERLITLHRRSR